MANWSNLIKNVKDVIRQNGNQEITGQVLQDTLIAIINNVGSNYSCCGVASPSTEPIELDGNVYYFAFESGTYPFFDNATIGKPQLHIFFWNGEWSDVNTGIGIGLDKDEIGEEIKKMLKAQNVTYDDSSTSLGATDVQNALVRIVQSLNTKASRTELSSSIQSVGRDISSLETKVTKLQEDTSVKAILKIFEEHLGDFDDLGGAIKYVVKKNNDDGTMDVFFLTTDKMDAINEWMDNDFDREADVVKCYYTSNNSGGGIGANELSLEARIKNQPNDAMVMGGDNSVTFSYHVYYGIDKTDIETGAGRASIYVNGSIIPDLDTPLRSDVSGVPNEYTINFGKYLTSAENNVELRVQNADGTLKRQWTWKVTAYSLTTSFAESYLVNQSTPKESNWDLPIRVIGSSGILHVKVDGAELTPVSVLAGSTTNIKIDADGTLEEGGHSIEAWSINDSFGFESEHIFTNFIKRGFSNAVVIAANAPRTGKQYGSISVPYYAYLPNKVVGSEVSVNIAIVSDSKIISNIQQKAIVEEGHTTAILSANASLMSSELGSSATMVITIDDAQTQHEFSVVQSDVELVEANECKVNYNFLGKSNADSDIDNLTSSYEGKLTSRIIRDWKLTESNGCDGEGFRVPINKRITLDLVNKLFAKDFGANGAKTGVTFAIELETSNVVDTDAIVLDSMAEDCGFRIYANRLEVKRAGSTDAIMAPFPEGEKVRIGFVIDGTTTHCVADTGTGDKQERDCNLAYLYIDGNVSRLFEYYSDSWKQEQPKTIVIGSDRCDVKVYSIRVYEKALTPTEWLNTYAYDTPNVDEKIAIATRNAVIDSTGEVSLALIQQRLPHTPIHVWRMDKIPNTKKEEVVITSSSFTNPDWDGETLAQASYEAGEHTCKADGTSSEGYPLPYKNLGETLNGVIVKYVSGDETSAVYSITKGTVGEKDFVDKVNYASSEGILNILAMNMYQKILLFCAQSNRNLLTKQQLRQYETGGISSVTFRQSLSGIPEIGFRTYEEVKGSGVYVTKYWSLFNLINNKYSGTIFGLDTKKGTDLADGKQAEMWEVDENVNFFNREFTLNSIADDGALLPSTGVNDLTGYTTMYYCRVPKKSAVTGEGYGVATNTTQIAQSNEELKNLQRIHNFIFSLNPWVAEQYKAKNGSYRTLDTPWTSSSGQMFTLDNPAYRRTRFIEEYQHYLNSDSACFYFVFCTWILGMDSMDKNMTIVLDDVTKDEPKASFSLRDTDTWGRFNNTGKLTYPWWAEWGDCFKASTGEIGRIEGVNADGEPIYSLAGATQVYNGALSGLWELVNSCLGSKIQSMYQSMRNGGLNDVAMMAMWQDFRSKWCEALYNYDAVKRYASTGNLDMAYGDKWAIMRDFFKKRTRYMDSKYNNSQSAYHTTMRFNSVPVGVWIENTQPTYASFSFGVNSTMNQRNINGGTAYIATPSTIQSMNNATCYLNDADLVRGFGGYTLDSQGNKVKGGIEALGQVAFTQTDLANLSKVDEFVMAYTAENPNVYQQAEGFGAFEELKNFKRLRRLIITHVQGFKGVVECNSEDLEELDLTGSECSGVVINACKDGCTFTLPATAQNITINTASIDSYSVFESIYNAGGSVQRISVAEPVNWRNASVDVILMLASAKSISMSGTITITDAVNADAKLALMEAFGDIDNPSNDIHIIYEKVTDEPSMKIYGEEYITKVGTYKYSLQLLPRTYNGLRSLTWSLSTNAEGYATIDKNGNLVVTAMPDEDSAMVVNRETIKVTAKMVRHDGDLQSQTFEVGLFKRMENITINISYATSVYERANEVYVSLDGQVSEPYPIESNKVEILLPYNVDVKISFKELETATSPRPRSFTTGQNFRIINVVYAAIVQGFAWLMKDGTEAAIGAVESNDRGSIAGLICTDLGLKMYNCEFVIPIDYLTGKSFPYQPYGNAVESTFIEYTNDHTSAMEKSTNGKELQDKLLESGTIGLFNFEAYCYNLIYQIGGEYKRAFAPTYRQAYYIVSNRLSIAKIILDLFEYELNIPTVLGTMAKRSDKFFYVVVPYNGAEVTTYNRIVPLLEYPLSL